MSPQRDPARERKPRRLRYSTVELLFTLLLLFASAPLVESLPHPHLIEAMLFSLVLIAAAVAIRVRGGWLWIAVFLMIVALAARWAVFLFPHAISLWVFHSVALLFLGYVVVHLLRFMIAAPEVNFEVLCAAVTAYLLIGLLWALNYMLVARLSPAAFAFTVGPAAEQKIQGFNAFYFSFVVLSTVGFGDIIPISKAARMLAVMEAVTGMFYVAILVSRLVAMFVPAANRAAPPESKSSDSESDPP